jgi:molybdopterin-binding protein
MNSITATISDIKSIQNLNIIEFDFGGEKLSMMSLDLLPDIKIGKRVLLVVKPTHVSIAKDLNAVVSFSNVLASRVVGIDNGTLLSSVVLKIKDIELESIIRVERSLSMDLKVGDEVSVLIQDSELSIREVLDD